jgi:hypothetical protein
MRRTEPPLQRNVWKRRRETGGNFPGNPEIHPFTSTQYPLLVHRNTKTSKHSKLQTPNSKLQTPNSKLQTPKYLQPFKISHLIVLATMEVESIQGLLWKYKKGITGGSWKKNWVFANNRLFLQWAGKQRPARHDRPKYELHLSNCTAKSISTSKKYSFEIIDKVSKKSMIFAADDQVSFQRWLGVLTQEHFDSDCDESKDLSTENEFDREMYRRTSLNQNKRTDELSVDGDRIMRIFNEASHKTVHCIYFWS